jgi:sulfide:quinone oxidoreductase
MLIEFKYDGVSSESFFADQTKPRKMFYHLKKDIFPRVYFDLMPQGKWHGKDVLYPRYE